MRRLAFALALVTAALASPTADAAGRAVVDPNVGRALATGLVGPWQRTAPRPGRATVLLELAEPATEAHLARLRAAGAELALVEDQWLAYDRFVPATLTTASVGPVSELPFVARVTLASGRGPLPLDQSATLVRLADARGARPALDLLTGKGVRIADIDTVVDVFHPTFFRADAGAFDWIDVDGDGVFTPGKDAIDLDRDGKAGPGETAAELRANPAYYKQSAPVRPDHFDPGIDWLYLDTSGNGARDYGAAAGFDDTAPALGEPLFVPDDLDRSGTLDKGERVYRLGTSKFEKLWVHLEYDPKTDVTFTRGKDLSKTKIDYSGGKLYGFADAMHGTGVATILAGDVPLAGRRWVGIAPEADLVSVWDIEYSQDGLPVKGVTWALKQKPDVMLHEMAPWTGSPLDGSDALSALIDSSTAKDSVLHTCPTGDQGSARKHAHADVSVGQSASLAFEIPAATKWGQGPFSYVQLAINIRGGAAGAITVKAPDGQVVDLLGAPTGTLSTGALTYATAQLTKRGTQYVDLILYDSDGKSPLPQGTYTLQVGNGNGALSVDGYVSDDKSSWGLGVGFDKAIADDASTIGIPSTADHCLAVNAEPGHVAKPKEPWYAMPYDQVYDTPPGFVEKQREVRAYSPRGPRIDGVQKPDVTAPDNPWVADVHLGKGNPYGSFTVFGGTSGASPHATGAGALLAQAGLKGDAARDALRSGALVDDAVGKAPNGDYGYGHLDIAGALGAKAEGKDPTVKLAVTPAHPVAGEPATLTPTADAGDGSPLEAKWDDGYDGSWDTEYAAVAPRDVVAKAAGLVPYKVRVRNAAGRFAEAVAWVEFGEPGSGAGGAGSGGAGAGGAATTTKPAAATPTAAPADSDGGCGCEAPGAPRGSWAGLAAMVSAIALAARRRRSR
jgi:hypothetical protein